MANQGTFIVLEGADGSGKTTQFNLLRARLEAVGHDVEVFDFPRYNRESSYFVRQYLSGAYGGAESINPYTASIFYALDRYEAAEDIRKALKAGKIVMADRFVGSNMAHQGSKFTNEAEQRGFFVWEDNLEFELLGIPRPTINIFLHVPVSISEQLIKKRGGQPDEHEKNLGHLQKSVATYELLCQLFPNDFKPIECTAGGKLLSIPEINNRIWALIQPLLPTSPAKPAQATTVKLNQVAEPAKKDQASGTDEKAAKLELNLPQAAVTAGLLAGLEIKIASDWAKNNYAYLTPDDLPKKVAAKYKQLLDEVASLHQTMRAQIKKAKLSHELVLPATPLAAIIKTELEATPAQVSKAIQELATQASHASLHLANELNTSAKKTWPSLFKQKQITAKNQEPEQINKILAKLISEHLPQNLEAKPEDVELLESWPKNEFKALVDTIYAKSNLSRTDLEEQVDGWSYQQKADALEAALKLREPETLANFHYLLDITTDRLLVNELLKLGLAKQIKLQPATPRYGYEVAAGVDEAVITDDFLACFDKSLELFSSLQAAERSDLAEYAALLGHKNRLELNCSLLELSQFFAAKHSARLEALATHLREKISEHHPIAAQILVKEGPKALPPTKPAKKAEQKPAPAKKPRRGGRRSGKK